MITTLSRPHFYFVIFLICITACNKPGDPVVMPALPFQSVPALKNMVPTINEASGIAESKANSGMLWVHEDSGTPAQLYLIGKDGLLVKKIFVKAAVNKDWEDIILAPGPIPGKSYLYIGDIGDNSNINPNATIYRTEEPLAATDTIRTCDTINFKYADGARDAEAFLLDNSTKDIYIITKREAKSRVYKLSYPYSITVLNTAVFLFELPYNLVVSAAMSADSKEIIVKTYASLYYYQRASTETIEQALQKTATVLGYQQEPQGEAICFANDNTGFFCLSENPSLTLQQLQFYKR